MYYLLANRDALSAFAIHPYNIARLQTLDRLAQCKTMQSRVKILLHQTTSADV